MESVDYDALPTPPASTLWTSSSGSPEELHHPGDNPSSTIHEATHPLAAVEERARASIEAYRSAITGKLVEKALVASADVVQVTMQQMLTSHSSEVALLNSENEQLRHQLSQASDAMERLTQQLVNLEAQRQQEHQSRSVVSLPTPASTSSGVNEQVSSTRVEQGSTTSLTHTTEGQVRDASHLATADTSLACASPSPAVDPVAFASLVADYTKLQGLNGMLEAEREVWRRNLSDVSQLLAEVVRENTIYQRELCTLRASSVPLEQYRDVVQARDEALSQLETMRLEAAKLSEQLEMELQRQEEAAHLQQAVEAATLARPECHASDTEGMAADPRNREAINEEAVTGHPGTWGIAIRELEEQAMLAVGHQATCERLADVEAQLEALTAENTSLQASLSAVEKEDESLRADAQSLTFRNAVLSQQVASLLVKVERLRRQPRESVESIHTESSAATSTQQQPPLHRREALRRDGMIGASAACQLMQARASARPSGCHRPSDGPPHLFHTSLDVSFMTSPHVYQTLAPVEVEHGLARALDTFTGPPRRRRRIGLRHLGCVDLEVELPCVARLPASDQLSGVALSRPSAFSVLDPAQGTVRRSSGIRPVKESALMPRGPDRDGSVLSLGSEREDLLDMLDMIDADESLDKYSVNTVAELVIRNQELLQQLYAATQQRPDAGGEIRRSDSATTPPVDAGCLHEDGTAGSSSRKRSREELGASRRAEHRPTTEAPAHVATIVEPSDARGTALVPSQVSSRSPFLTLDAWTAQAQESAAVLVEAVLQRHEARIAHVDQGLSAALLPVLSTQYLSQVDALAASQERTVAADALVDTLIELCTTQAVTLAQQAVTLAASQDTQLQAQQACWDGAQQLLASTVMELRAVITAAAARSTPSQSLPAPLLPEGSPHDATNTLESIALLLQMAVKKEGTLQRVYQSAQTRQAGLLRRREAQLARREARLERRRELLRTTLASSSAQSPPPASSQPPPVASGASPTRHTPLLAPLCLGSTLKWSSPDLSSEEDLGSDVDAVEEEVFQELQSQVALEQAKAAAIAKELDDEKRKHLGLYERMWKVELDRDAAVAERDAMAQRMDSMKTQEDYESVVADLDVVRAAVLDLEAQLRFAHQGKNQLQTKMDTQVALLSTHQQRHDQFTAQIRQELHDTREQLAAQVAARVALEEQRTQDATQIDGLHTEVARLVAEVGARDDTIRSLGDQLEGIKHDLLSADNTQTVLRALYPEDTVLEGHTKLVAALRRQKDALETRVHYQDLQQRSLEKQVSDKEHAVRTAVHERQVAEVRLQEALLTQTQQLRQTPTVAGSDTVTGDAALAAATATTTAINGGPRRLQALEATITAQQRELDRLRAERQDWRDREEDLRAQLEAMGRDPISEAVRRYGLPACRNFDSQLAEFQTRLDSVRTEADALRVAKEALEASVAAAKEEASQAALTVLTLTDRLQEAQGAQQRLEEELVAAKAESTRLSAAIADGAKTLATQQQQLEELHGSQRQLQTQQAATAHQLQTCEEDREKFLQDNMALIEKVQALQRDLAQSDVEKQAANAALAQGLSTASGRRHHHRRGGPYAASRAPLTEDLLLGTPSTGAQYSSDPSRSFRS